MDKLDKISKRVRKNVIAMHSKAREAHIGSALSIVDILTVLYFKVLNINKKNIRSPFRDKVILSKGHASSALYAVLSEKGIINEKYISTYCLDGGKLCGHVNGFEMPGTRRKRVPAYPLTPGIEGATGSLGHGLPMACGMALAAKHDGVKAKIFVIMGDGECNEGSVWEAALFAAHFKLDNLTVVVDRNHLQGLGVTEDVMGLEPLLGKWISFGWRGAVIDGHDMKEIERVCGEVPFMKNMPSVIIAETLKGKGVSFMENRLEWHYKSPDEGQCRQALAELD